MITQSYIDDVILDCIYDINEESGAEVLDVLSLYGTADSLILAKLAIKIEIELLKEKKIVLEVDMTAPDWSKLVDNIWRNIPRKVLVTDLDGCMWEGILTDTGNVKPRVGYQATLRNLQRMGVILAICSFNDASFVTSSWDEVVSDFSLSDFASINIRFANKAQVMVDIANELNLPLDSFVFVDDDQHQRNMVSTVHPEILVINWDEIFNLKSFDHLGSTEEDSHRTQMYNEEKERQAAMSVEGWLENLGTELVFRPMDDADLDRIYQLFSKTNQMNFRTRRLSKEEIREYSGTIWAVRARDNFGSYGLVGIVALKEIILTDFILSCRALGRGIEESMLIFAHNQVVLTGNPLLMSMSKTDKNGAAQMFYNTFIASYDEVVDYPDHIKVVINA